MDARRSGSLVSFTLILCLAACVQTGDLRETGESPTSTGPIELKIERCVDRTETQGRDLVTQATRAFEEKLRAVPEFVVKEDGRYRLACEVSGFVEGSAIKRWVLPGWGATVGQVSAMVTDSTTGEILIIAEGNATVASGGLYTIGAEEYIVRSAVDDVVARLQAWARGEAPASGAAGSEPTK